MQALAVVEPQQHDAVPQEARHVGEELQVEGRLPLILLACHAVGCLQAQQLGLQQTCTSV